MLVDHPPSMVLPAPKFLGAKFRTLQIRLEQNSWYLRDTLGTYTPKHAGKERGELRQWLAFELKVLEGEVADCWKVASTFQGQPAQTCHHLGEEVTLVLRRFNTFVGRAEEAFDLRDDSEKSKHLFRHRLGRRVTLEDDPFGQSLAFVAFSDMPSDLVKEALRWQKLRQYFFLLQMHLLKCSERGDFSPLELSFFPTLPRGVHVPPPLF